MALGVRSWSVGGWKYPALGRNCTARQLSQLLSSIVSVDITGVVAAACAGRSGAMSARVGPSGGYRIVVGPKKRGLTTACNESAAFHSRKRLRIGSL